MDIFLCSPIPFLTHHNSLVDGELRNKEHEWATLVPQTLLFVILFTGFD